MPDALGGPPGRLETVKQTKQNGAPVGYSLVPLEDKNKPTSQKNNKYSWLELQAQSNCYFQYIWLLFVTSLLGCGRLQAHCLYAFYDSFPLFPAGAGLGLPLGCTPPHLCSSSVFSLHLKSIFASFCPHLLLKTHETSLQP